ncbi:MAG: hypothetical protein AVDCRST_MAG68-142 [uncultured Gemmatimonadetes bacterium]|uniref:Uncharacterized protein n=1 Tax=uncultured Gemmatimonadota bacterium TaxID=203437 RepID=A0A6J4K7F6_9BACT|nr:MAG: hypothetical protein AVDCRST_MAG68-142 [uncultured Gemmatimonadota bacterium]
MIRAALRSLSTTDLRMLDIERDYPEDPECFSLLMDAYIGPEGEPGQEQFSFYVRTPTWVAKQVADSGSLWEGALIVEHWDYRLVRSAVQALCARATGSDWAAVAAQLGRHLMWEFDGMTDHSETL